MPLFLQMAVQQTAQDPAALAKVLAGIRAYQAFPRPVSPMRGRIVAQNGRAHLIDYGGEGRPVLFVPSLINPPYILDLAPEKSLIAWLAEQDMRPLLLDWGNPQAGNADLSIAGHVETLLLPMLETLGPDTVLAGYCLGGTMALAAATRGSIAGLILIATPWDFAGYDDAARQALARLWANARPAAEALGVFPMEMLQAGFWQLDPARTIAKFAEFGELPTASPEARAFVTLEDWANDGPPLTLAAARELIEDFYQDNLPGRGAWHVAGAPVDPARIDVPILNLRSITDRIVPWAASPGIGTVIDLARGHVGMLVGRHALHESWMPIRDWLSQLRKGW